MRKIPLVIAVILVAVLILPGIPAIQAATVDDGHCVVGSTSGSTTWYFAEGCVRQGFNTYLCLANPNGQQASVKAIYILGNGTTVARNYQVSPQSRSTVSLVSELGFRNDSSGDVSIKLTSNRSIVAERPMYFEGAYAGGHDVMGATSLEKKWYFAEGYTGAGFDEYICVLNTGNSGAGLTFRFQTQEAGEIWKSGGVPAHSRATFKVNDVLGANYQSSLMLESSQPVVAERSMYFDYLGTASFHWQGGHCVMGLADLAKSYYFAEGTTRSGFEEWLTLQNPGAMPITIHATYQLGSGQGGPVSKSYIVGAKRRTTIFVNDEVGPEKDVSAHLSSSSNFLAERPMYFRYTAMGANWTGGHCVIGAMDSSSDWFFAEGYTGEGFHEWLTIQNPGSKDTQVRITYLPKGHGAFTRNHQVMANSRYTVFANADAGGNLEISCKVNSDRPIVVERPMYFSYAVHEPAPPTPAPESTIEKVVFARDGNIWIMNLDGSRQRQLTSRTYDDHPVISPDGSKIAFDSKRDHFADPNNETFYLPQVYVMDADGSGQHRITEPGMGACMHPSFLSESNYVLFCRQTDWNEDTYSYTYFLTIVSIGSGSSMDIASQSDVPDSLVFQYPASSPGYDFVYSCSEGTQAASGNIEKTEVVSATTMALIPNDHIGSEYHGYYLPALSKDGGTLAMCRDGFKDISGEIGFLPIELMITDSGGGNRRIFQMPPLKLNASGDAVYFRSSWTRDGRLVVSGAGYRDGFGVLDPGTEGDIYMLNSNGQLESKIAERGISVYCGCIRREFD